MRPLKPFNRFAHEGVRRDLESIISKFKPRGCKIGSSGDGEVTLRNGNLTAYVRKYRKYDGWSVQFWGKGSNKKPKEYFQTMSRVEDYLGSGPIKGIPNRVLV